MEKITLLANQVGKQYRMLILEPDEAEEHMFVLQATLGTGELE